jgi:hypothetical protein
MINYLPPVIVGLLVVSCAVRPPLFIDTHLSKASLVSLDSLNSLKGYGDISFSYNGERFKATFDLQWRGDTSFIAAFYGPAGMSIASVKPATPLSWKIEINDSVYLQRPSQKVAIGQDFLSYPFTWQEFIRILTGRLPEPVSDDGPDTVFFDGKHIVSCFKKDTTKEEKCNIMTKVDTKTYRLNEILYDHRGKDFWKLQYTGFKKGRAKEIKFILSDNNYFYLRYHSITAGR